MDQRLHREIRLLYKCEAAYKLPDAPIVRQLVADAERPLPDVLPAKPQWVGFTWPADMLDFQDDWRRKDRGW